MKKGQEYVGMRARELGLTMSVVDHEAPSASAEEKARLLGWPVERVVKAVYATNGEEMIGFVAPSSYQKIPIKKLLQDHLGMSARQAKRYSLSQPPSTMRYGTCTPFAHDWLVGTEISRLFLADEPDLCTTVVDVSLGGTEETDLKLSAQLCYGGIYQILSAQFGDRVRQYRLAS